MASTRHDQMPASRPLIVGLAGCTCGGKSTAARALVRLLEAHGVNVAGVLNQDVYYKRPEELEPLNCAELDFCLKWDEPSAVNWQGLLDRLDKLRRSAESVDGESVVLLDGNMLTEEPSVASLIDVCFFITLPVDECRRRRMLRVYEPPDVDGYFDRYVWPMYVAHEATAKGRAEKEPDDVILIDGEREIGRMVDSILVEVMGRLRADWVHVTHSLLPVHLPVEFVRTRRTGAVSAFVGVARDDADGAARVLRLEYEAYEKMALAKLAEACQSARSRYPELVRLSIMHRLGCVPVGEPSVVIAASSAHRRAALDACSWLVDELKRTVPIWKKEVYADGSSTWRQNVCGDH